jgi:hypothetical protein
MKVLCAIFGPDGVSFDILGSTPKPNDRIPHDGAVWRVVAVLPDSRRGIVRVSVKEVGGLV